MADYFPLLSRTIASLGNSTAEQRQIVYERARSVVADQLSAIEPPMDSDAISRELKLFEACVMRLEHDMTALESIKPVELPSEQETRKHISARLSDLLAKAAAARAEAKQALLKSEISPSSDGEGAEKPAALKSSRPSVDRVPEPAKPTPSRSATPQVTERKPLVVPPAEPVDQPVDETLGETASVGLPDNGSKAEQDIKTTDTEILPPAPEGTADMTSEGTAAEAPSEASSEAVSEAELSSSASVLLEPASLEQEVEGRLSMLADAEMAAKAEADLPSPPQEPASSDPETIKNTDPEMGRPSAIPLPKSWLQKVQTVWSKRAIPASAEPGTSADADRVDAATADQAGTRDAQSEARLPSSEEAAQQSSALFVDEHFVGPVRPPITTNEGEEAAQDHPQADSIVFSDDAAQADTTLETPSDDTASTGLKPPVASEIELLDDGRPRLAQRRKRDRSLFRGVVMGVAFLSLIAAVAGTAWVLRDRPADFEQGSPATRSDLSRKITDRLPSDAVAAPAAGRDASGATADAAVAAGQRVIFFEEAVEGQPETAPVLGRVNWALETIRDQTGAGDVAVKAEIKGLNGSLTSATVVIKRNRDIGFPASHLIELAFVTPEQGGSGRVRDIGPPEMRAEEGLRGATLSGVPVPVTENVFLVGLTNLPDKIEQNRDLLRSRNWMMIPMRFASGRRAVLLLEKGLVGDRVLLDAFQAWK